MTPHQVRGGLSIDPFTVRAERGVSGKWLVRWDYERVPAATASFVEQDGGIRWLRFLVEDGFRGRGIYTQALRWSCEFDHVTAAGPTDREMWRGFKESVGSEDLKLDLRSAKPFVNRSF